MITATPVGLLINHDPDENLQGYTNYQIEHHLFPRLPMLRYRELQPRVQAIFQKHGIPYVRQNVFIGVGKLLDLMVGTVRLGPNQLIRNGL